MAGARVDGALRVTALDELVQTALLTADAGAEDAAQDGGVDSGSESAAGYYQSSP